MCSFSMLIRISGYIWYYGVQGQGLNLFFMYVILIVLTRNYGQQLIDHLVALV